MKRILMVIVYIIVSVFLIGTFISCTKKADKDVDEEKIRVVVSIPPQAEFVERVGEDRVIVTVMVSPGASPHTYEPTPGQLEEISKAKIYAKVGSGIEFELAWMDKIIKMNGEMLVVDCSSRVKFITVSYKYGEAVVYYEYDESDKAKSDLKGIGPYIWLLTERPKWLNPVGFFSILNTVGKGLCYNTKND